MMQRRGFIAGLLAAVGIGRAIATPAADGWTIDWRPSFSGGPLTNNPAWVGKLRPGPHNRTYLNGKCVNGLFIRELKTGQNGYVIVLKKNTGDSIKLTPGRKEIQEYRLDGSVRFEF